MLKNKLDFIGSPIFEALRQQEKAYLKDEVPVGAVVTTKDGLIIASAHNLVETDKDMSAHAEFLALKKASKVLASKYLYDCDLYTTLEPCILCASAAKLFRIRKIYYCCEDVRWGLKNSELSLESIGNHSCQYEKISGLENSGLILKEFFQEKRKLKSKLQTKNLDS